jgi:hypothetical protein
LKLAGRSTLAQPAVLTSTVLPLTLQLVAGTDRPHIEIHKVGGTEMWQV